MAGPKYPPRALDLPPHPHMGTATDTQVVDDADRWTRFGPCWRLLLLLWLGWTGWHYLTDPDYWSIFSGIIFGSHEFGHLFFAFMGHFMGVAGGSLMQLLVPIGTGGLLLARRDYFGASVAGCWLSFSLSNLAVYVGDAVAQELPLVSFSPDGGEHDWFYLLDHFNALGYDLRLALIIRRIALLVLAVSFLSGAWWTLRARRYQLSAIGYQPEPPSGKTEARP